MNENENMTPETGTAQPAKLDVDVRVYVMMKIQIVSAHMVMPTNRDWNHRPNSGPSSISIMVQNLSENVIMPIAGVILAFVMTLELVQILMDKNNFHDVATHTMIKNAWNPRANRDFR